MSIQQRQDRRDFIKKMSAMLASAASVSTFSQLAMIPKASAQVSGYKALVCIYLAGANDSFNWLVPRDSEATGSRYDTYRLTRGGVYSPSNPGGLAHAYADLLPIDPSNSTVNYGLHPAHTDFSVAGQNHLGLQSLFNTGKAAFVCNAGPLIQPITKAQYQAGAPRPAQLFSHNDQQQLWHMGFADRNSPLSRTGWGGRLAQAISAPLSNGLSPTISIAGSTSFGVGETVVPYQLASSGIDTLDQYSASAASNFQSARRAVLDDLLDDTIVSPHGKEYARIFDRSLSVGESLATLLNGADGDIATAFPDTSLGDQLRLVARLIKVSRASLSAQRQVFYVRMGSFDLHDGMFEGGQPVATSGHGALLTELNQALGAFWSALGELNARSQVTSFTMSDFGRTLTGNGNGSDHAWGGNMMVLGDQVQGGRLYGSYPDLVLNSNNASNSDYSFERGQYIPTTSVNQIGATLARWMGVTDTTALNAMFPQLTNFSSSNLGFML
jgi:uncharacterized protein (DUF1501 family)